MININEPLNTQLANILKGLSILVKISDKAKIISHSGAIDVVLQNNKYTTEDLDLLVLLGWEELSDFSWRYWLEKKPSPWITLAGKYENDELFFHSYEEVLDYIAQYRKDLDEEVSRYYDEEYQIVEEKMYDN